MKQQPIVKDQQKRKGGKKGRAILAVKGLLPVLGYIILLPLIAILAILLLSVEAEKAIRKLRGGRYAQFGDDSIYFKKCH